jgi:hypothetical protein
MQKLETGDLIERTFAEKIRELLPCYETIWGKYIGNDGDNTILEIPNESDSLKAVRKQISQLTYSLMHNALAMQRLLDQIQLNNVQLDKGTSAFDYFERRTFFNGITLECGKTRDHIESIYGCLEGVEKASSINTIFQQLEDLYSVRHIGIHGKELPYFIENDQVYLPYFDRTNGWKNEKSWDDAIQGEPFSQWANQTIYLVISKINEVFCKLTELFELLYNGHIVKFPTYDSILNLSVSGTTTISGSSSSSGMVGVSGYSKPSTK